MALLDESFSEIFPQIPKKGDVKRLEIIKAAIHCMARDGFDGGTLEKVAQRLKTRRSHVAYYYTDKEELLSAVMLMIFATTQKVTQDLVAARTTAKDKLLAIGEAGFEWLEAYPDQGKVLLLFFFSCCVNPKHRKLNQQVREAGRERFVSLLKEILHGKAPAGLNFNEFAHALQAMINGFILDYHTASVAPARIQLRNLTLKVCNAWLKAAS